MRILLLKQPVVKEQVEQPAGGLLDLQDFPVPLARQVSLGKALSDPYQQGDLKRLARGLIPILDALSQYKLGIEQRRVS